MLEAGTPTETACWTKPRNSPDSVFRRRHPLPWRRPGLVAASLMKPVGFRVRDDFGGVKVIDLIDELVGD